jgi:hypothetical protein
VQLFLDLEGGGSIEIIPEPDYHADRRLSLLRQFFRLGVRGMQLTHNGRNQLGDGIASGKMGGRLSPFGVEVVQEMNRLGMMIGVRRLHRLFPTLLSQSIRAYLPGPIRDLYDSGGCTMIHST